MPTTRLKISPAEYAKRLGVDRAKVLGWIHAGDLPAINVASTTGGRPQYRIDEQDIAAFEERRDAATSSTGRRKATRAKRSRRAVKPWREFV